MTDDVATKTKIDNGMLQRFDHVERLDISRLMEQIFKANADENLGNYLLLNTIILTSIFHIFFCEIPLLVFSI